MVEIVKSATFDRWLRKLKDRRAAARVLARIDRLAAGNPGDVKPVGSGISEQAADRLWPGLPGLLPARGAAADRAAVWWRQVQSGPRHRASAPDRRGVE